MLHWLLLLVIVLAALSAYLARTERMVRLLALGFAIAGSVIAGFLGITAMLATAQSTSLTAWWRLDEMSGLMITLVAFVYCTAVLVSYRYIGHEYEKKILPLSKVRLYFCLLAIFVLAMFLAVMANNLGILWMGLEATTLATTFLVSLYRKEASIEAAWKYIMLCSVGISLGLLGMLMFFSAAIASGLTPEQAISLSALQAQAHLLDPALVKWAFIFVFIGLGTKVGFVPMHTWLPDAHSKTPSPISAMLSGILLNVAFYAILRFKMITDVAIGSQHWSSTLFLTFGTLSVVVAAFCILQSKNYKRTLAYSSVEHMGLIAFMVGLGPVGFVAALIHMVGHTITKSLLFFGSGEFFLAFNSTHIAMVRDAMRRIPVAGTLFLFGIAGILAIPPSPFFVSELLLIAIGVQQHFIPTMIVVISLTIVAYGMLQSTTLMLYGKETTPNEHILTHSGDHRRWNMSLVVMVIQMVTLVAFGFAVMNPAVIAWITTVATAIQTNL